MTMTEEHVKKYRVSMTDRQLLIIYLLITFVLAGVIWYIQVQASG